MSTPKEKYQSPPAVSLKLIQWVCKPQLAEELEGNLIEYHQQVRSKRFGLLKYWSQVFQYIRPSTVKIIHSKFNAVFTIHPKQTLRNLFRHTSTSVINIIGFTLGLVASILLYFYIHSELTYDHFHEDRNEIYRAVRVSQINKSPYKIGVTSGPYARALANDFPEDITAVTRVHPETGLVSYESKQFFEEQLIFADANFFQFFSFPLQAGDPKSVLGKANAVVMTAEMAKKYFGDENPLGKIITVDNEQNFEVTGVVDELPSKSHIVFDMVFSIEVFERYDWFNDWWNNGLMTYVNIPTKTQAAHVNSQLAGFMDKYFAEDFKSFDSRVDLELESLNDIYFNNETRYDWARHGNLNSIYILILVAIAILFIACFNYVNLSIAQSFVRAKEVSVRKVLGVTRSRLVAQLLSESLMIFVLSLSLSVLICQFIVHPFNAFFDLDVVLNWGDPNVFYFFLLLLGIVLTTAGIYPAVLLSSCQPIKVLKGSKFAGDGTGLRKGLVVLQFAISIFLIVSTLIISAQTDYLNSKDLGFDKEAVVILDLNNSNIRSEVQTFKDRLLTQASIREVSGISGEPGGFHDASSFKITGLDEQTRMRTVFADEDYLNLLELEVIAGRAFSKEVATDSEYAMIFNEKAVSEMGLSPDELIGRNATMPTWGIEDRPVIGVVKDFHFSSLKDQIEPLAIICGGRPRKLAIKVNAGDLRNTLLFIDKEYTKISPDFPMSYFFLDEGLEGLYQQERKQANVFTAFSFISILLACLGIFGLAAYAVQQRQKELGIRKVLGASARQVLQLVTKQFVFLLLVALLLALPLTSWFMNSWLGNFAYRIEQMDYWHLYVAGGAATIAIAIGTIVTKTFRAAISNPTESIRNE